MAQRLVQSMKTILEVVSMPWGPAITDDIFTVIAKIEGIHTEDGWFYATCSQCSKLLDISHGLFWCDICNGLVRYPMIRFKVHLRVEDDSGGTILTMYNQEVERLIDTSANKLFNSLWIGNNGCPLELFRLTGRTFVFHIRMPDYYNPDPDFHNYRIVSLSEIDRIPQIYCPVTHANKVEKGETSAPVPIPAKEEGLTTEPKLSDTQEPVCAGDAFSGTSTPLKSK